MGYKSPPFFALHHFRLQDRHGASASNSENAIHERTPLSAPLVSALSIAQVSHHINLGDLRHLCCCKYLRQRGTLLQASTTTKHRF